MADQNEVVPIASAASLDSTDDQNQGNYVSPVAPATPASSSLSGTFQQLQNLITRELLQESQRANNSTSPNHVVIDTANAESATTSEGRTNNQDASDETTISSAASSMDFQMFTKWLEQCIPYFLLLLLVFCYKHMNGILRFLWQVLVFFRVNHVLRTQVALKGKHQKWLLVALAVFLWTHVLTVFVYFHDEDLWRHLLLIAVPTQSMSITAVFWVVIMNDYNFKFLVMGVKAIVVLMVGHKPPYKRNAQLYSVIEMISNTYRNILPIPVWFRYLYNMDGNGQVFSAMLAGVYLVMKFTGILEKIKQLTVVSRAYVLREVAFGTYATSEQVTTAGETCAICQEKFSSPILLRCNHVFCEDCVSEWFDREKTCPLCRTAIQSTGVPRHSDGGTSLLVQLF